MRPTVPGLVSTIIAVYNRPRLLREAVDSVLAQTYRPIEILIVDDGSTDETRHVAQALARQHPTEIRYLWQTNQYFPAAWNHGLREARGEFIQWLDSDDLLLPRKFEWQVAALTAAPDCGMSYGYVREYRMGETWSGTPARRTAQTFDRLFPALLEGKIWPSPSPLYRASVVDQMGEFLEVRRQQDWEFESRAGALGVRLHHCREYVGETRGTHRLEGRVKGGWPSTLLPDYAHVLLRILGHARAAGTGSAELSRFTRTLGRAARQCAEAGHEREAQMLMDAAIDAAQGIRRAQVVAYRAMSRMIGLQRCARVCSQMEQSATMRAASRVWHAPVAAGRLWHYRARAAAVLVHGQPILRWPGVLAAGWAHRRSRRA